MRSFVACDTGRVPLRAYETVLSETLASLAMSCIVVISASVDWRACGRSCERSVHRRAPRVTLSPAARPDDPRVTTRPRSTRYRRAPAPPRSPSEEPGAEVVDAAHRVVVQDHAADPPVMGEHPRLRLDLLGGEHAVHRSQVRAVSYTHLTLPTNREV